MALAVPPAATPALFVEDPGVPMPDPIPSSSNWPDVAVAGWAPTKKSLHLYAQMLGKLRLALSPAQPNWMFTALAVTARGLSTGLMPGPSGAVEGSLDVFDSRLVIERSDGERRTVELVPARAIADVYADFTAALDALAIACKLTPIPQEVPDTTPFDKDRRPAAYDPAAVRRWFAATTSAATVFDRWRSHFAGRSGIQVWWGALDVALLLFNGKRVAPPTDRGYLMKYDLDAELMNAGLYVGDGTTPPYFYGYIYPEPPGAERLPIAPHGAVWSTTIKEWVLPYDAVRTAPEPERELRGFLDALYGNCIEHAGWNREALSYDAPK
jgi:hypothetical protein